MPDTLHEKALKQPFRVGLMLGALIVPTGWVLLQDAWNLALGEPILGAEDVTRFFAFGCVPGMILGAGALRARVAWLNANFTGARWILALHGASALVCALSIAWSSYATVLRMVSAQGLTFLLSRYAIWIYAYFPFHCALVMLLIGIFMRSRRA